MNSGQVIFLIRVLICKGRSIKDLQVNKAIFEKIVNDMDLQYANCRSPCDQASVWRESCGPLSSAELFQTHDIQYMTDFQTIIKDKNRFKKIMESAFRSVDIDGSGFLDESQLQQILIQIAKDIGVESPTNQQISKIMRVIDQNGDGQLSKQQFYKLIQNVLDMMVDYGDM